MSSSSLGYLAQIFRHGFHYDYPGDVLRNNNAVVIVEENRLPPDSAPNETFPAVKIKERNENDTISFYAEPAEPGEYLFGGSFIFRDEDPFVRIWPYPIPLYDRKII